MTLSIGALFPWGRVAEAINAVGGFMPQAVILAADSRWTYSAGDKPYDDIGTKLFQLLGNAAAVYAGDVEAGERGSCS